MKVEAFNRYRGTGWMPEPYKAQSQGDRFRRLPLQAFALTGDAGNTELGYAPVAAA